MSATLITRECVRVERRWTRRRWVVATVLSLAVAITLFGICGLRTAEAASNDSVPSGAIIYVSPLGSDSNDGSSWSAAKATLSGALGALPNCTSHDVKGESWTFPCGQIEVDAGTLTITSPVIITSPFISIIGRGSASTQFTWAGAGCAITVDEGAQANAMFPGPTLEGFSIDGSGNANGDSCGLHYENFSHVILRDMTISDFSAAGDSCLYGSPGPDVDERAIFEQLYLGNCTVDWLLKSTSSTFVTMGYGNIDMYINVGANQTGVESIGSGPSAELVLKFSVFHIIVNVSDPSGTCASLLNYSDWADDTGVFRCDGHSKGFQVDGTSYFYFGGDLTSDGNALVSNGGHLVILETAQDSTTGYDALEESEQATPSDPGTGPTWGMVGQYWNGTASAVDEWKFQQVPSQSRSDLAVQHIAGPTAARFDVPALGIFPGGVFGGYQTNIEAQDGGYFTFMLPAANGTAALTGANGVSAGKIMLFSSSGSYTFATPYNKTPVCTATDTTRAEPVRVTATTTGLFVMGTSGDAVAWICTPTAN